MTDAFIKSVQELAIRATTKTDTNVLKHASWPRTETRFGVDEIVYSELWSKVRPYVCGAVLRSRSWMTPGMPEMEDLVQDISLHLFQLLSVHGPNPRGMMFAEAISLRIKNQLTHRRNCKVSPESQAPEDFDYVSDTDIESYISSKAIYDEMPEDLRELATLIAEGIHSDDPDECKSFITSDGALKPTPLRKHLHCSPSTLSRKLNRLGVYLLEARA